MHFIVLHELDLFHGWVSGDASSLDIVEFVHFCYFVDNISPVMNKLRNPPTTFRRFLREYLALNYAELPNKDALIEERCTAAQKVYQDFLGMDGDARAAYACAMAELIKGYSLPKYEYVEDILLEYFPEKIDWRQRKRSIRGYVSQLEPIFERYGYDDLNEAMRQEVIKFLSET